MSISKIEISAPLPSIADVPKAQRQLPQASARWKSRQKEVKNLSWSMLPSTMVQDFLEACQNDIRSMSPNSSHSRSALFLSDFVDNPVSFVFSWGDSRVTIDLQWTSKKTAVPRKESTADEVVLSGPEAMHALKQAYQAPTMTSPATSVVPVDFYNTWMKSVEEAFPRTSDFSALLVGSVLLSLWQRNLAINSDQSSYVLEGVSNNGEDVRPNQDWTVHVRTDGPTIVWPALDITTLNISAPLYSNPKPGRRP